MCEAVGDIRVDDVPEPTIQEPTDGDTVAVFGGCPVGMFAIVSAQP